jgi:hypothetical protein
VYACCAEQDEPQRSPTDENAIDDHHDCGCFDVQLTPHLGVLPVPAVKFVLVSHFAAVPPMMVSSSLESTVLPLRSARDGPPLVRLLVPSARQTIRLI